MALLDIRERFDDYFRHPQQAHLRRDFNRASRAGMTFCAVDPEARLEEMLDINRSAETRQGQPMHPHYLDEARVKQYFESGPTCSRRIIGGGAHHRLVTGLGCDA